MNRYVVYPVADRLPHSRPNSCGLKSSNQNAQASKGVCSVCSEPVWFLSENLGTRVLVCWPCASVGGTDA